MKKPTITILCLIGFIGITMTACTRGSESDLWKAVQYQEQHR